ELRQQLVSGLDHGGLLGLAVGRVAPQKNYDLLISIAQHLRDVPINFCIAGAADEEVLNHLQNRIHSTDLGKARITFLGARTDITTLMAAADFYILTSHWEARALVVQEALIAGLPIVASDVGGIPELVEGSGELVDPHTPDAAEDFAQVIRSFLNPQTRLLLSRKARERGQDLPDEDDVAAVILDLYRDLLPDADESG
ncbi:MAG TPA: glycosyltransferase, partial [Beutenbergiaceae bacterium]|nr:glycosyltransferase [Beutenbergiaceae bacterium]